MRVSTQTLAAFLVLASISTSTLAFSVVHKSTPRRAVDLRLHAAAATNNGDNNLHEFDYLLGEGNAFSNHPDTTTQKTTTSRRRIVAVANGDQSTTVQLVSSATVDDLTAESAYSSIGSEDVATAQSEEYDPFSENAAEDNLQRKVARMEQHEQFKKGAVQELITEMNWRELIIVLVIPSIALFGVGRWGYNKFFNRFMDSADAVLGGYATEMIYHDGDFDEMKMCTKDYNKRLLLLGPKKKDIMMKRYLELYAKRKIVSPQSISSLSYAFTIFKLSEEKAAQTLVSLCKKLGPEKISSSGKLLFFGSRILKSPEGKAALEPIKDMIKDTYRDEETADAFVDASQTAMGEAAYRHAVQETMGKNKNLNTLVIGWEVLGLTKETATRIWEDEKEEGFVSDIQTMYGGQTTKYDKKGNILDQEGNLADPENADVTDNDDDDDSTSAASGNVFECEGCGFTLFIAKGRDFKFYGDDFKCSECGAGKDQFVSKNIG